MNIAFPSSRRASPAISRRCSRMPPINTYVKASRCSLFIVRNLSSLNANTCLPNRIHPLATAGSRRRLRRRVDARILSRERLMQWDIPDQEIARRRSHRRGQRAAGNRLACLRLHHRTKRSPESEWSNRKRDSTLLADLSRFGSSHRFSRTTWAAYESGSPRAPPAAPSGHYISWESRFHLSRRGHDHANGTFPLVCFQTRHLTLTPGMYVNVSPRSSHWEINWRFP